MAAYAASKGGVQAFTHSLALETANRVGARSVSRQERAERDQRRRGERAAGGHRHHAVREVAANPADRHHQRRRRPDGPPEAAAGVVAMLASDDGEFITGTEIRTDGGTHA